ncbi:hypothetical protein DVT68_00125 [Dyella solisilvae]|uniref:Flagellar protein n=1 Tax=Dyella solisilvae TaxID=1920168 RepID=A0A370KB90_9GAMM|nr:hypothetical protein [Dyella solisilvae]RDI99310.1 hypothetical protein DVT68_00125 [Dyella solisilvae]
MMLLSLPAGASSAAIPYRTAPVVSAGSIALSMSVVVLVMVALVALVLIARRRGWLGKLGVNGIEAGRAPLELRASRRLSVHSTAHVLSYQGREFLIVESVRHTATSISPIGDADPDQEGAP